MPQSGTLNPPKTLLQISWLCFTTGHILCCEENKKKISPLRQKLIILVCGYLKFFAFQCQEHKKLLNFFFASVFSNCAFLGLTAVPRKQWYINQPSERGEIINFEHVLSAPQLSFSPSCTVLMTNQK